MAEYTKEWITQVRGDMSKTEFGKHICQFKKDGTKYATVHRNTIGNWESGKCSLSKEVETFLSLALFEYDKTHSKEYKTLEERNQRYFYAKDLMYEMIGVDFYCRHLHDALLIQVCRGIISFEELIPLEKEFESELKKVPLTKAKKDEYAIERNTVSISADLLKIDDVEKLRYVIMDLYGNSFASANRLLGARIGNIYGKRNRYGKKLALQKAVGTLAPNYRDSYNRMFKSSFISRDWLIDFCIHLRFDPDEISEALECAHMAPIANEEELKNRYFYLSYQEIPLLEKLKIMLLIGMQVKKSESVEYCPNVSHLLEAYTIYHYGREGIEKLTLLLSDMKEGEDDFDDYYERIENISKETIGKYLESIESNDNYSHDFGKELKKELMSYYMPPVGYEKNLKNKENAGLIYYLVAVYYTVLTGKKFEGKLKEADFTIIKNQFGNINEEQTIVFRFLLHMLGVFLSGDELAEVSGRHQEIKYYSKYKLNKAGRPVMPLNVYEIMKGLWESIPLM